MNVASAYYRIHSDSSQYIDIEFNKFIQKQSYIPIIIKINQNLRALSELVAKSKDLVTIKKYCTKVYELIISNA